MNVSQIKALSWLMAVGLSGGMGYYVYTYWTTGQSRKPGIDEVAVRKKLEDVPRAEPDKIDIVPYDSVLKSFHTFDWVGNPPPDPAAIAPVVENEVPKASETPVAELIKILLIQEDSADASQSSIFIEYLLASQVMDPRPTDRFLQTGERLLPPHEHIRIEKISALEGVTFAFDDEERAAETLLPNPFQAQPIVVVDAKGVRVRERASIPTIPQTEVWRPKRTQSRGRNEFVLGQEDMANFAQNYTEILAREVNMSQHRDPQTGRYDGIQISGVRAGSTAERHGAQDGDIIKSINGQPVTSPAEAITFVKNNSERYTRWEVVVENKGRTRTMVYNSPEP